MAEKYSVDIMPGDAVITLIKKLKTGLKGLLGTYPGAGADAHIILFTFEADAGKLAAFDKKIRVVCNSVEPFAINCTGFDEFFEHKTIYAAFDKNSVNHITALRKKLSGELRHGKFDEEVNFESGKHPHITIARTLSEHQFSSARKYFMNRKLEMQFKCNGIVLRKLVAGNNFTKFETVNRYNFAKPTMRLF